MLTKKRPGFTIVELLIVIVVIAILATISVVAYRGIQGRARDAQRQQDIRTIAKALEMYYLDNGRYPPSGCTTDCSVSADWVDTNGSSWANLAAALVPKYVSSLPTDPKASLGANPVNGSGTYGYAYFTNGQYGLYCGVGGAGQMYILVFTLESSAQQQTNSGTCITNPLNYYGSTRSQYRVAVGGS